MPEFEEAPPAHDPPTATISPVSIGAAVGAAILGAVVWGAISHFTGYEVGYVAWAIGGAVGIAIAATGGRGTPMAVMAAVMALASIFTGKMASAHFALENALDETVERSLYDEYIEDAKGLAAIDMSEDSDVVEFMISHNYTGAEDPLGVSEEELSYFKAESVPMLSEFHSSPPAFESWSEDQRAQLRRAIMDEVYGDPEAGLIDMVMGDLAGMDLLFAFLGIATAFQLVMRASM